ncbi:hypothetical protein XF35_37350 [Streptomyces platensis subsp. clarensis]|nr:hypothetical protein [Streptomyces platensis subsp. clarensis]
MPHARPAEEIRGALDGAANGTEAAEYHNKKAYIGKKTYIEHDRRAGRAALNEEYDVRRRLRKALHYS